MTFILGDIFYDDVKIGDATVVTLYLLPALNERLRPELWRELKPGTPRRVQQLQHGRRVAAGQDGARGQLLDLPVDDPEARRQTDDGGPSEPSSCEF